jgi:23S rRNA (cytidine1920-2'-O)/16S rRNA (cytidine1409-2'-O)-methyltransferase
LCTNSQVLDDFVPDATGWAVMTDRADAVGPTYLSSMGVRNLVLAYSAGSLVDGLYEVLVYFPASAGLATTVPVDIVHATGTTRVTVDQTVQPDTTAYLSLGVYAFLQSKTSCGVYFRTELLAKAVVADAVCLDVGQSTGGFTDCLLQAGAARVVGVDVGHGQLDARLRGDARMTCIEHLNARALDADALGRHLPDGGFDLVVCDASFISLTLLLPQWPALLKPGGRVLALVKPQFELGPEALGKGGIVRDAAQYAALEVGLRTFAEANGLNALDYFDSPITGGDGNREFFMFAMKPPGTDHDE